MKRSWIFACLLLWWVAPAQAHRLDEYLQATTIAVAQDHLTLRLRLTPGVAVAPEVIAGIDTNDDETLSQAEQSAYAERVRRDLTLAVDGTAQPLQLIAFSYPALAAMRNGAGDIQLTFEAALPPGSGRHQLSFENHHQKPIAVYMVNCLLPDDPGIRILGQGRNVDQSSYQLMFTVGAGAATPPTVTRQALDRADDRAVVQTYFVHGVHHILTGYDHLLFACALVLAATTLWDLVKVVTAFTLAHSITLTLAAVGLVHLPARVVEPLISASIVFVALQNIFWSGSARGRSRLAAAFFFGLFHGLGFAGGLLDLMHQMPAGTIWLAILGFSIGVEVGHQIVLLPLFGLLKVLRRSQRNAVTQGHLLVGVRRIGSAGIAAAGMYYLGIALTGAP